MYFVDEEAGVEALAVQAPVVVGEGEDDRIDLAGLGTGAQFVEREHSATHE